MSDGHFVFYYRNGVSVCFVGWLSATFQHFSNYRCPYILVYVIPTNAISILAFLRRTVSSNCSRQKYFRVKIFSSCCIRTKILLHEYFLNENFSNEKKANYGTCTDHIQYYCYMCQGPQLQCIIIYGDVFLPFWHALNEYLQYG